MSKSAQAYETQLGLFHWKGGGNTNVAITQGKHNSDYNGYEVIALPALSIAVPTCMVDTSPIVNFGEISPADPSARVTAVLGLNCNNPMSENLNVTLSIVPKLMSGDKTSFPLLSPSGEVAGDIRGFLGDNAQSESGCTDAASSLVVNGHQNPIVSIPTTSTWSNDLVWVLCPRKNAQPGPATATATIDVNW